MQAQMLHQERRLGFEMQAQANQIDQLSSMLHQVLQQQSERRPYGGREETPAATGEPSEAPQAAEAPIPPLFPGIAAQGAHKQPRSGEIPVGAEKRQMDKVKTKRREAETVKLQPLPRAPNFRNWKMAVRDEIAGASGDLHEAFQ